MSAAGLALREPGLRIAAASGTPASTRFWLGIAALLAVPLVVTPILPPIDLYNHVARFYILSHLEDPFLQRHYAANWQFLPNIGLDIPATLLARWLDPLLLAKLLVAGVIALQVGGTLFLNRALTGRVTPWSGLLAAGLGYSFILSWGFMNYLLAAALALWTLGLWVRLRDQPVRASVACAPLALAILFCHGFAFGLYGLVAAALEFGLWWRGTDRSTARLARGWGSLALQAVAPAICFLAMPTAGASTYAAPLGDRVRSFYEHGTLAARLWRQLGLRLESLVRVAETPWPLVDTALFAATAVLLLVAFRRRAIALVPAAIPALVLVGVMTLVMPAGMFGAGHLFERLPLLLALIFAASLGEPPRRAPAADPLLTVLVAVTALRFMALTVGWSAYGQQYAAFERATTHLPQRATLATVLILGNDRRDGLTPRCQMLGPLAVMKKHAATPLFADPTQQPLLLRGELRTISRLGKGPRQAEDGGWLPGSTAQDEARLARIAADRSADAVLVCGRERLTRPLPANLRPIGSAGGIDLYAVS